MGGYYCGLCGVLAESAEAHKKICKCEALVERAKRHAEERDHYRDEVQRLNLQVDAIRKILVQAVSDTAKVIRIEGVLESALKRNCRHESGVMKDGAHPNTCPDCGEAVR